METGNDGLEKSDDVVEGKELSAMRVAGQLKVDAESRRGRCGLRAMGQQYFHRVHGRIEKSELRVALVRVAADRVGDAGDDELRAVMFDDAMRVLQEGESELLDFENSFARPPVVLMISGDVENAVARLQIGERRDLIAQLVDVAVDEIAGDDDRIGVERICL